MVSNTLLYCAAICVMMIAGPYILFSKEAVKEYINSAKRKIFDIIFIFLSLLFIVGFGIIKTPQIVNRLYETKEVTVKEITGEWYPLGGVFEVRTQRFMVDTKITGYSITVVGSKKEIKSVHAENLKEKDKIELRQFAKTAIVTKKNGKETSFYKKYYEDWLGNPVWDRNIFTLMVFINILVHIFRFGNKAKNHLGCAIFSIAMFVCIWKPIETMQEAFRWGCLLSVLFIGYQILDFIWCIRNPEYYNIPYPKLKGKYFKIEDEEKVDILTQRKHIDYVCPNCGGKMVTTEDHKFKKCYYCDSLIPLTEDEREDVNEILHVLDIPKADCAQVVRKICMRYKTKADYNYLSGANLTLTDPGICSEFKKHLHIPAGEKMYFIYDSGFLSSLKFGLAICKTGIYFRNSRFKKRGKYSWEEFKKIQIFADDSMLNLGRVKFYEAECRALGELLLKIQKEI